MAKYFLAGLLFIISLVPFTPAYACSGGIPRTLRELVRDAETVVQGVMEYVDSEGQNGILRVEKTLAGARVPQHILLALYPATNLRSAYERSNAGGCWSGVRRLSTVETIIIFLKRLPNGTYELSPRNYLNPTYYAFPNAESTLDVFYDEAGESFVIHENYPQPSPTKPFTLPEFEQLITELADTSPLNPLMTTPLPLPTSLYIRTINGTEYELPVDFSSPRHFEHRFADSSGRIDRTSCSTINCIGTSPNRVDYAQVMPDDTIQLISLANRSIMGRGFSFSTTSDTLVVWNNDTLTLYALPYDRLGFCCFSLTVINSIGMNNSENITHVAWSPDGRQIAYNDAKGLYLWDAFTVGSQPLLLETITATRIVPRFFSATGRYLAIQRGDKLLYIDMVNQTELEDGLLSPDDRFLLQFDTRQSSPLSFYRLTLFQNQIRHHYENVRQAEWIGRNHFIVANCHQQPTEECYIWKDSLTAGVVGFKGFTFAYEKMTDTLAIAQRNERISIVMEGYNHQTYDLNAALDSEIEAIYWMPPIFYQP